VGDNQLGLNSKRGSEGDLGRNRVEAQGEHGLCLKTAESTKRWSNPPVREGSNCFEKNPVKNRRKFQGD